MKKIFFFLAAMALAITANAKVTTISPDAENDALRLAVHYAEDGDIIEMTEGTYVQCNNGYVAFDGKAVTVRAAEGANVVLQPQVRITLANGGKATFENIKIDASRIHELADWYEHVFYVADDTEGKELVMEGCEFYGFDLNKSAIYSKATNKLDLCSLTNCYFHNNDKSCLFFEGESLGELSITNSTFANITAKVTNSYYAGVVDVRNSAAKVTIDHCTFYNCLLMSTDYAAITMKGPQAANVVISNNIFMLPEAIDGHRAIRENVEATNCMTFNYVKDNGGIHSSVTKTNCQLNVDPKFVDAANGNFALAEGSPALTAGTDGKAIGDPRWNVVAEPEPTTETVYFINAKKWAKVNVYAWTTDPNASWPGAAATKEAEQIAGYDVYSFTANAGQYANVIFNDGSSQTPDLVWTAGKYYVIDMGWLTKEEAETKLAAPLPETWNIVGAAGLMGKDWDLNAAENAMTLQADGTYKLEKKGITLTAGTYEYKAAKDHGWTVAVPQDGNQTLTISTSGIYDVTFVLNVTAKKLTATATLKQAAVVIPTIVIAGDMNSWNQTKDKFTMSADSLTATFKTTLAVKNYGFKMIVGGSWHSDGKTITRAANSTKFTGANSSNNSTLKADIAGEYLFTWEYATKTLTVTYPALPVKYNVTVTAEHGTVTGAGTYEEGKTATLTATPAEGYQFVNWTKGEEVVSTENPYKFTVTADVALVANFELIPPTKYNVTVTAENGTVEGAGEYEEGKTATLTATANEGYEFVNWTVGEEVVSTENPYTFTVTADIALVANFELIPVVEPEKPEPVYEDNNLNPYAFGLESVLSDDKTTLTVTYRLNNSKATSVNVVIYNGEEVVATVPGTTTIGKNTVEVPTADLPGGVELKWAVEVNGTSVEVPTQETKMYNLYCPHGLAIDKDPESEYFGRILVAEAMQGVPASGYVTSGKGAGLYVFNPSFTTDSVAYKGGNDFTRILASNGYQPYRVKISEDGRIFVSSLDLNGVVVWEVSKDLQTWTPVISGTNDATDYNIYDAGGNFVAGLNCSMDVIGSGEDLKLLLYSTNNKGIAFNQSGYRLDEYALGTATTWTGTPKNIINGGKYGVVHTNVEFIYDGEGGYWFGGSRAGNAGQPNLVHINAEGVEDYRNEDASLYGGDGVLLHNGMLFKGKARTSGTVGNFGVWTVGKDADGKVTLTEKWSVVANGIGRNLNEFAVDYAENLYAVGNSGEKIIAYALPYSGTVETPAASQYAFQLEAAVVEPVELVGVVKRALTIGESTVVLTHEADGTAHIYNIVGEEIAEVSQEGVVPVNPDNLGDYLAISDIAVTEDGKLVARNYMRVTNLNYTPDAGYERGENRFYIWNDLAGAPSVWFTSLMTSNSIRSDQGITMAVKGTSTNAKVLTTGVHNAHRGIRMSLFFIKDGKYVDPNGGAGNKGEYYWYLDSHYKSDAIYNEAAYGVLPELSASPLGENNWIMDNVGMAPSEFSEPADGGGDPIVNTVLADDVVGKKFNGATYVTIDDQVLMVAPYATAEGLLAGVKVLDITAGLASATEVAVADLDDAVEATAAATAVVVDEDKLIITLVGDATLYTLTAELTQDPGPGTALDNIAVEAKAIKMIKNGQLIIIKNGVQYNVQGQVIK